MRFYELFSEQKNPMTLKIEELKSMFRVEDKYKLTKNIINRIIIPAQKELKKLAPYSFNFTPVKIGKKITAFTFTPFFIANNRDKELETKALQKKVDLYWSLSDKSKQLLQEDYKFTIPELKRHTQLWKQAEKQLDLPSEILNLKDKALKARNPKGYLINTLKKKIQVSTIAAGFTGIEESKKQPKRKMKSHIIDVEPIDDISTIKEVIEASTVVQKPSVPSVEEIKRVTDFLSKERQVIQDNKSINESSDTLNLEAIKEQGWSKKPISFFHKVGKWIVARFKRKQ